MCIVCLWNSGEQKIDKTIKELYCEYCATLKSIPFLPELKVLNCSFCPNLRNIPLLNKLEVLYCSCCPKLTRIPPLPKLTILYCAECPNLKCLPKLPKLKELYCAECKSLTDVADLPVCLKTELDGCKWFKGCENFDQNIVNLKRCQSIFKRKLLARKLLQLISVIEEIYYSPGCKGEFQSMRHFRRNASLL